MDKMDSLTGYRADTKKYCGRIDVKVMLLVALGLMLVTQLYITIWYLSYHVWYWFIALALVIAANALLGFAFRTENPQFVLIVAVYQALFVFLYIGAVINLIVVLCHPYSNTYIYRHCAKSGKHDRDYCAKQVRIASGVYFPLYLLFALINLWCLSVLWSFYRSLKVSSLPSYNPNARAPPPTTNQSNPTVGQIKSEQSQQIPMPAGVPRSEYDQQPVASSYEPSSQRVEPDWGNVPVYVPGNATDSPQHYQNTVAQPQPTNTNHLYDTTPSWSSTRP